MIKFCLQCWDRNKDSLRKYFESMNVSFLMEIDYDFIVKIIVGKIFNNLSNSALGQKIHKLDDGDYQGTIIYLIPFGNYQPSAGGYLMTYIDYGSCSGCDALEKIKENTNKKQFICDLMNLCKDIVNNTIKPYNYGWRHDKEFDFVEYTPYKDEGEK